MRWVECKMTMCDIGAELGFSPQFGDRDIWVEEQRRGGFLHAQYGSLNITSFNQMK